MVGILEKNISVQLSFALIVLKSFQSQTESEMLRVTNRALRTHPEFKVPFPILSFCFGNIIALCNLLEKNN